jgi:hypothetical protein
LGTTATDKVFPPNAFRETHFLHVSDHSYPRNLHAHTICVFRACGNSAAELKEQPHRFLGHVCNRFDLWPIVAALFQDTMNLLSSALLVAAFVLATAQEGEDGLELAVFFRGVWNVEEFSDGVSRELRLNFTTGAEWELEAEVESQNADEWDEEIVRVVLLYHPLLPSTLYFLLHLLNPSSCLCSQCGEWPSSPIRAQHCLWACLLQKANSLSG